MESGDQPPICLTVEKVETPQDNDIFWFSVVFLYNIQHLILKIIVKDDV